MNLFKAQNNGHIIMLGSIAGKEPYAGGAIYTATFVFSLFLILSEAEP